MEDIFQVPYKSRRGQPKGSSCKVDDKEVGQVYNCMERSLSWKTWELFSGELSRL